MLNLVFAGIRVMKHRRDKIASALFMAVLFAACPQCP